MRLCFLALLVLFGVARCQWTASFPNDEVVRQINMNYLRQLMDKALQNPATYTVNPDPTPPAAPAPAPTPSAVKPANPVQPTRPAATNTNPTHRRIYFQPKYHSTGNSRRPQQRRRPLTIYDWVRANHILNPEFDIHEFFAANPSIRRMFRNQARQANQANRARHPAYRHSNPSPSLQASMSPPVMIQPRVMAQQPQSMATNVQQPQNIAARTRPRNSGQYYQPRYHNNQSYYRRPQRRRRPVTLYDWIRANQLFNPEFDIMEFFGGA